MKQFVIAAVFVCAARAQLARVGDINFYGLRSVTAQQVLDAAQLAPGGSLSRSRTDLEDRIIEIPEVLAANVQTVCCDGDRATLFIGIEERGGPSVDFRLGPSGSTTSLPAELMTRYREYQSSLLHAELTGSAPDANVRRLLEHFQTYAASHTVRIRAELRNNPDTEQRAAAAVVTRYLANKLEAVNDLIYALRDPEPEVRMNAARSLAALATLGQQRPSLGIRIPPDQLADLLDSVVLSDRVESVKALLAITDRPNAATLDLIRKQSLSELAEMARWTTPAYAQPPFRLLGRAAGLPDTRVSQAWENGGREEAIREALDSASRR